MPRPYVSTTPVLDALRQRKLATKPLDIWDVDELLAESKDFADMLPAAPERTNRTLAELEASQARTAAFEDAQRLQPNRHVGVVGALADSAATPIRVVSSFGGPLAGFAGEAIASGLESVAYLDGKALPPGGSIGSDIGKLGARLGIATAFGAANEYVGPLSKLAERTGTSLAKRLTGTVGEWAAPAAVTGAAGAVEGGALNVAQGAATRGIEGGDPWDPAGFAMDVGLGAGIGGAAGAALGAVPALAARSQRLKGVADDALRGEINAFKAAQPAEQVPYWAGREMESWQRNQANMGDNIKLKAPGGGTVRGPAPRSRMPPPGVTEYGGAAPTSPLGPEYPVDTALATPNPHPPLALPGPGAGAAAPNVSDIIEGVRGEATAEAGPQPSAVRDILDEMHAPPSPEQMAREGGPRELPAGRYPAGSPEAAAAQPFTPPEAYPTLEELLGMADPMQADVQRMALEQGPQTDVSFETPAPTPAPHQQFSLPVPPAIGRKLKNAAYGTPTQVASFAPGEFMVSFDGRAPTRFTEAQFNVLFPELAATLPTQGRPTQGPDQMVLGRRPAPEAESSAGLTQPPEAAAAEPLPEFPPSEITTGAADEDPLMRELLGQVGEERRAGIPQPGETVNVMGRDMLWTGTQWVPTRAEGGIPPTGGEGGIAPTEPVAPTGGPGEPEVDIEALLRQADEQDAAASGTVAPRAPVDLAPGERRLRHSSYQPFDTFSREAGASAGRNDIGHWFTDSDTAHFGPIDYDAAVKLENPYHVGTREQLAAEIDAAGGAEAYVQKMREAGHDGVTLTEIGPDGTPLNSFVPFGDEQARMLGRNMRDQAGFDQFASPEQKAAWEASQRPTGEGEPPVAPADEADKLITPAPETPAAPPAAAKKPMSMGDLKRRFFEVMEQRSPITGFDPDEERDRAAMWLGIKTDAKSDPAGIAERLDRLEQTGRWYETPKRPGEPPAAAPAAAAPEGKGDAEGFTRDVLGWRETDSPDHPGVGGYKVGDTVQTRGKQTGTITRLYEVPAKGGKPATWRAEVKWSDGMEQGVSLEGQGLRKASAEAPAAKAAPTAAPDEAEAIITPPPETPAAAPETIPAAAETNAPAPETNAPAPETKPNLPETEGIELGEGDTPGTINQAGKFVPLGDDWRSHDPAANKNLVIRKADGTYQVVKNNGGKTPKKWNKDLAEIRDNERVAREAKAKAKAESVAKNKADAEARSAAAKARQEERAAKAKAEGQPPPPPEPAEPAEPVGAAEPTVAPIGPTRPPVVDEGTFNGEPEVGATFERSPSKAIRETLMKHGFKPIWKPGSRDPRWKKSVPKGSTYTLEDVKDALRAILRGEDPPLLQDRPAAPKAEGTPGEWAPPEGQTVLLDRPLSTDTAEREARRNTLKRLGWTQGMTGTRRTWHAPGTEAPSGPVVPPANPPQAGAPSGPSATAATPTPKPSEPAAPSASNAESQTKPRSASGSKPSTDTAAPSAAADPSKAGTPGGPDEIRIAATDVKVDPVAYQFKTSVDKRGRTSKLKGVKEWDTLSGMAERVTLHKRLDGSYYVVDGHQRVGLAQDLIAEGKDVPDLYAVVLNEADGVTVDDARRAGAMRNLTAGTTDPLDIARVLRSGDFTPSEQARVGAVEADSGEKFRQGRDISKLSDEAFDFALAHPDIPPRLVRLVSQYHGDELQQALLGVLSRNKDVSLSHAKSLLAKAADRKTTATQGSLIPEIVAHESDVEDLVKFEQSILGVFKKNRRTFGGGAKNAEVLQTAGETRIDKEAMTKIGAEAERAEELFDNFVNAQGSHTKQAIKEAFDEHKAGTLSLGKASERVAAALEADVRGGPGPGGPPAGPSGGEGPGGEGGGADEGPSLFGGDDDSGTADEWSEADPAGGLFDNGAVEAGHKKASATDDVNATVNDMANDVLASARRLMKKLGDERGSVPLDLGDANDGLPALEEAYKHNPGAVLTALRTAGGGLAGAMMADADDENLLDNILIGAAAGYHAPKAWRFGKAAIKAAPRLTKDLTDAIQKGRLIVNGEYVPIPQVRAMPDRMKDISGIAKNFWTPDKVIPDVWKHVEPIMRDIYDLEGAETMTPFQRRLARRQKVDQALSYMTAEAKRSKDLGHTRRLAYIDELMKELKNKPTWIEKQITDLTNDKVTRKQVRQANAIVTNAVYHQLLGWGVDSGLANMTQALMNIPQIGVDSTVRGIIKAYSKEGRQELKFLDLKRRPMGHDEERLFHPWVEKYLDYSQTPMRWSDSANRRATWAGAQHYAQKRGMSQEAADDFARQLVGQTQGIAGDLGSNPFHRHWGPLRVFTKYPFIWASMLEDIATHPDPRVKMRALGMVTGIYAASAISGIEYMNFFTPRMGGLPGPSAAYDVLEHSFGSPEHDFEEHFELGGTEDRILPRYWNKGAAILKRTAEQGGTHQIVGRKGEVLREISAEEDLLSLLGIETTEREATRKQESQMYDYATEAKREESILSRQRRRRAGLALASGDVEGARTALEALSRRQRQVFEKGRRMTTRERARRQTPVSRRAEFDAQFEGE